MFKQTVLMLAVVAMAVVFSTCSIDHGIEAQLISPKIRGTVFFEGEIPANTEWVVVVASREFPPSDVVELAQSQSRFLDLRSDSARYEITLPAFGSYAAVGAVWKGKGEQLALSDVLGIYGVSVASGFTFPDTVRVSPSAPVADSINFVADFSRVNRGAVIRGQIRYADNWPGNTEFMAVAAYKEQPQSLLDFLNVSAISIGLPHNVDSYDYRLAAPPGTYNYVVVLWKGKGTSLFEFEEVGFYETEPGSGVPGSLTVALGDTARGVDIEVDFSNVN